MIETNYHNCDIAAGFLFDLPSEDQRHEAMAWLIGAITPYVPTAKLEDAIAGVRQSLANKHAPVHGSREPDRGTPVVDCVAKMPGEG